MSASLCLADCGGQYCPEYERYDAHVDRLVLELNGMSVHAGEVVQKEGTKLASRHEFAKRVAMDLYRYELCSIHALCDTVCKL